MAKGIEDRLKIQKQILRAEREGGTVAKAMAAALQQQLQTWLVKKLMI